MKLNTNIMAVQTNAALTRANLSMSKASARLSSGLKLNVSSDGSAAVAMATKMQIKLKNSERAGRNASDAASLIQTADGALNEIRDMVQRIRELSVQAGNETLTTDDRDMIQNEIEHYKQELTDASYRAEYNGIKILSGEADNIFTPSNNARVMKVSDTVEPGNYVFTINSLGTAGPPPTDASVTLDSGFTGSAVATAEGNKLTITDVNGRKIVMDLSQSQTGKTELKIELRGLVFQVGASKDMETRLNIPKISAESLELDAINVNTWQDANSSLTTCDAAIAELSRYAARIGAYVNRMSYTNENLDTTVLNLEKSLSVIKDADMAKEMINYTKAQILVQADISMLAQANQQPQQLLQLLQR